MRQHLRLQLALQPDNYNRRAIVEDQRRSLQRKNQRSTAVTIPGLSDLLRDIKKIEDHAKACRSIDENETRVLRLTREEADVVESYRRFKAQDYD